MADFNKIVRFIINRTEGGLQHTYKDAGNWRSRNIGVGLNLGTNWGISGALLCMLYPKLTDLEVKNKITNLTLDGAINIYKINFWNTSNIGALNNDGFAYQFFDHLINSGNILNIKKKLIAKYPFFKLTTPYGLSSTEVQKINAMESDTFYNDVMQARKTWYGNDVENAKRPAKWPYEKKKSKPKSSFKPNASVWDWLSSSFNNKKFRI